jgi:TrmH family RNA methyltransferase
LRAGQGAHFLTRIVEAVDLPDWAQHFGERGGVVAAGVAHGGSDLYAAQWRWPLAVVVGNEGAGISGALLAATTLRLTIPMPGGMESLNAGAATAVMLFEAVRRSREVVL